MILYINTINTDKIEVAIKDGESILDSKTVPARRAQAEKLLPLIDEMLKRNKISFKDVERIQVVNVGDDSSSFTALRIGVVTANALGYALSVPVEGVGEKGRKLRKKENKLGFDVVEPVYSRGPNITKKKKNI